MKEEPTGKKHYYAAQSPRGFANEIHVCRFASRAARDKWVEERKGYGDCNSAVLGGRAISAVEARRIAAYHGDAITESYNTISDYDETSSDYGDWLAQASIG